MKSILLIFITAAFPTHAQSLADVLSSIQERKQAVEQCKQLDAYLKLTYTAAQTPVPPQALISWDGLGSHHFPIDTNTASLGIDARVNLLNQTIDELRILQRSFLNVRKEDLASGSKLGALRPYLLEDFADPGRADAANYHQVLRMVALSVRRLSVLEWPVAGYQNTVLLEIDESPPSSQPAEAVAGSVDQYGTWTLGPLIEDCELSGEYSAAAVGVDGYLHLIKEETYFEEVALYAKVPGQQEAQQLNGSVAVIARSQWSPVPLASISMAGQHAWFDSMDGSYLVLLTETGPDGNYSLGGGSETSVAPQITVQLEWTTPSSTHPSFAYPAGAPVVDDYGAYAENSWAERLAVHTGSASPEYNNRHYIMGRRLSGLFAPAFSKGVDAPAKAEALSIAEKAAAGPSSDAALLLHPATGMLLGIPVGVGLDGGAPAYIGVTPGEDHHHFYWDAPTLIRHTSDILGTYAAGTGSDANPAFWELPNRFDHAASLRFIGASGDFHVVYETSRLDAARGGGLPALAPTQQQVAAMGCGFFFRNWDLPRLKQVVSRDFIVNIKPLGHYKNEVKIYRRPAGSGVIDRTPGKVVEVSEEAILLRTLVIENPDASATPYPDTPEKLHVSEGDTTFKIWRTGYPDWDYRSDDWAGVVYPDLYSEITEGGVVKFSKMMDFDGIGEVTITQSVDGSVQFVEAIEDEDWYWFLDKQPTSRVITQGARITEIENHFDPALPHGSQYGWFPETTTITTTGEPVINFVWNSSGRLISAAQAPWSTAYSIQSGAIKSESKFGVARYTTAWTVWSGNDTIIKSYHAPNGVIDDFDDPANTISELILGDTSTGLPGLPHKLINRDNTETRWTWNVANDHSGSLTVESGVYATNTLATGYRQTGEWNTRGFTTESATYLHQGGINLKIDGTTASAITDWGAPLQYQQYGTGLTTTVAYDANQRHIASITDGLGVTTAYTQYDALDRLTNYTWNGHSGGTITHNPEGQFGVKTNIDIDGKSYGQKIIHDASGRITGGNSVTAGSTHPFQIEHTAADSTLTTGPHPVTGATHSSTHSKADGSLVSANGSSIAFGGIVGEELAIEDRAGYESRHGLFRTTERLDGLAARFQTTWSDAWGRVHAIESPSSAGGTETTTIHYSRPLDTLQYIEVREASGRRIIQESAPYHSEGILAREGIDLNRDGVLDASDLDRFVATLTTIQDGVLRTIHSQTGNAASLMISDFDPSSGESITILNGGEDIITETTDFTARKIEITHERGNVLITKREITLNELGQVALDESEGTGMATNSLAPARRPDGSVASADRTIAGVKWIIHYGNDGRITGYTHPLFGELPVTHDYAPHPVTQKIEQILACDGTTATRDLDGAGSSLAGDGVMDRSSSTIIANGGFAETITPNTGAPTTLQANAAGAKTLHEYAAGTTPETTWFPGGLLQSVSLGRGNNLNVAFDYSNDGAKDLFSIKWPKVESAGFPGEPLYGNTIDLTQRDAAGNITVKSDPSGTRVQTYQQNRPLATTWTDGHHKPYQILREYDDHGRTSKIELLRNNVSIHTITPEYVVASDEISGMSTDGFSADLLRDPDSRLIIGFTRGGVEQHWDRGTAGRITGAHTNGTVTGAPSFNYTTFDPKGRRKTVQTNRGSWFYDYKGGNNGDGQLAAASNGTLNAQFNYNFDGIGRRVDFAANANHPLNQFVSIEHPQTPRNLYITAHPDARLWVNGVEAQQFDGAWIHPLGHPGASGGWIPWSVTGVLEDAGEGAGDPPANPHANADAIAAQSGHTWFPPTLETITYDADGNRESSALWNYGWDGRNRLVRARTKTWDTAPQGWDVTFDYDAEGRRFKKEITRYESGERVEEKVVHFVWDGWNLLYERHQDLHGNLLFDRKYIWGPDIADGAAGGAGGLMLIRETRGQTTKDYYPIYDGTGHVTGLTDSTGHLVAEYWYGPFGELIESKGPQANLNPFRYASKYFDEETGLYYFGHRYYDPTTGQWLKREPLGENESLNLYAYCGNDPVNRIDVMGLRSKWVTDPNNPVTELADGSKLVNLVWYEHRTFRGGYLDYSKCDTREYGANYFDYYLWSKRSDGSWGTSAHNQMWVDAATIAEDKYHLSTHAKVGTVAMGLTSAALAAPAAVLVAPTGVITEAGILLNGYSGSMLSSIGSTTLTFGKSTYTLGQLGAAAGIMVETGTLHWLFTTDEGWEYGQMVSASSLPPQQKAMMLGLGGPLAMIKSTSWFGRNTVSTAIGARGGCGLFGRGATGTVYDLAAGLNGVDSQSTRVAEGIRSGEIGVEILGRWQYFKTAWRAGGAEFAFGTRAFAQNGTMVLKASRFRGGRIFGDAVHEGTHVLDMLSKRGLVGRSRFGIEARAWSAEMQFLRATGRPTYANSYLELRNLIRSRYTNDRF